MVDIQGAATTADELYGGQLSAYVKEQASNELASLGIDIPQGAVNVIGGLGSGAIDAVAKLSKGNVLGGIDAATPVIAGTLALIPGVGLAGAAVVAAGGAILDTVAHLFGLDQQPIYECKWKAGEVCFFGLNRAYGPTDDHWLTLEQIDATPLDSAPNWHFHGSGEGITSWLEMILPTWELGPRLYALGDRTSVVTRWWLRNTTYNGGANNPDRAAHRLAPEAYVGGTPEGDFLLAFYRAWIRSYEFAINGYQLPPDFPYKLLLSTAGAWNAKHTSRPRTAADSPSPAAFTGGDVTFSGTSNIMADHVVNGLYTGGQREPPITIYAGSPPPSTFLLSSVALAKGISRMPIRIHLGTPPPLFGAVAKPLADAIAPQATDAQAATLAAHQAAAGKSADTSGTLFSVGGVTVTKKQGLIGGVVIGGGLLLRALF